MHDCYVSIVSYFFGLGPYVKEKTVKPLKNNNKITNSTKTHPVGVGLFHKDRRTEMTRLIVAFTTFLKAPKNDW